MGNNLGNYKLARKYVWPKTYFR